MSRAVNMLIDNIEKIIIGKRIVIEHLLVALLSDGHVLIEDVPGVGKTQLVASLARSVNGKFKQSSVYSGCNAFGYNGFFNV